MNKSTNVQNPKTHGKKIEQPAKNQTGVLKGLLYGLGILAMIAFWATFAYAIWVQNLEMVKVFATIIAIGVGVFGTVHFVSKLFQDISKRMK